MKLGHWLSRRPQAEPVVSQFVPALDRVREMREGAAWEPLTTPGNIRERAERVTTLRRRITIPHLASERERREWLKLSPRAWLHDVLPAPVLVIAGVFVIVLVWLTFFED